MNHSELTRKIQSSSLFKRTEQTENEPLKLLKQPALLRLTKQPEFTLMEIFLLPKRYNMPMTLTQEGTKGKELHKLKKELSSPLCICSRATKELGERRSFFIGATGHLLINLIVMYRFNTHTTHFVCL